MRVLLDAKEMSAGGTGLARYERETARRVAAEVNAVTIVRRAARRDRSSQVLRGRIVAVPDCLPSIVVEQLIVPLAAWVHRVDVVHSMAGGTPLLPVPRRITTFHEDRCAYYRKHPPSGIYSKLAARWHLWLESRALAKARRIIAVSETSATVAQQLSRRDRSDIVPVPHGVSDAFRQRRRGPEAPAYVLFLSSGDPRDDMTFVFSGVAPMGDRLSVKVVGDLRARSRAEAAAAARKAGVRALFAGRVSDEELADLYSQALCYIHPSSFEGFGLAVAEAMACGTVVVGKPSPAFDEVAGDCGFRATSPLELTETLAKLLDDPAARVRHVQASVKRAERFDWDVACLRTMQAYR